MRKKTTNIIAMKKIFLFACVFTVISANAQPEKEKVIATMKEFHLALVQKNIAALNAQMDDALSYGHSSGWIQTKADVTKDFESGMISYQTIKEDSIQVSMSNVAANVRYLADVNVTMRGNTSNVRLKVLEVWIKKGNDWVLFSRQAMR
jgi:hypothetical protein